MAFDDEDLRDEIAEMFQGLQATRDDAGAKVTDVFQLADVDRAEGPVCRTLNRGYRVFTPNPIKSAERKVAVMLHKRKYDAADIRARLLAGERPKLGGRGRPPTRWIKMAAELGIDLSSAARVDKVAA